MKYLGTYTKKLFIVYLKFQLNWASSIFIFYVYPYQSGGTNPHGRFGLETRPAPTQSAPTGKGEQRKSTCPQIASLEALLQGP